MLVSSLSSFLTVSIAVYLLTFMNFSTGLIGHVFIFWIAVMHASLKSRPLRVTWYKKSVWSGKTFCKCSQHIWHLSYIWEYRTKQASLWGMPSLCCRLIQAQHLSAYTESVSIDEDVSLVSQTCFNVTIRFICHIHISSLMRLRHAFNIPTLRIDVVMHNGYMWGTEFLAWVISESMRCQSMQSICKLFLKTAINYER